MYPYRSMCWGGGGWTCACACLRFHVNVVTFLCVRLSVLFGIPSTMGGGHHPLTGSGWVYFKVMA